LCVLVLQAWPGLPAAAAAQSVAASQPHVSVPDSHFEPFALPAQLTQAPEPPHALSAVPAAHVPALQQPPLHRWFASHLLEQVCASASQDSSAGQSLPPLQPHAVPFSQMCPAAEAVQSLQAPVAPHALSAVPATHVPAAQQPPLHAVALAPPHDVEQVWAFVSHDCPDGQSAARLHPHVPVVVHACPALLPEQSAHTVPLPPHWVCVVPGWHVPDDADEQHPVGQACAALHVKTQMPPVQPWAPAPQSLSEVQPHWPPPGTVSQV
jgi:hypothetical protein